MFLAEIERKSNELKEKILGMPDGELFSGTVYYVSADGDDQNDGLSPETPWKTPGSAGPIDHVCGSSYMGEYCTPGKHPDIRHKRGNGSHIREDHTYLSRLT